MDKVGAVLVVGGGIAGMQTSIDLADSGFKVYLAEETTAIGGVMSQLDKTFPTNDCAICILAPKLVYTGRHENIDIIINSKIKKVEGVPGNFTVEIVQKTLYIDQEKCTGCGLCGRICPVEAIDLFNEGLSKRGAISVKFPQAVPLVFSIDREKCIGCGICRGVCKAKAVDYELKDKEFSINVGAVILAIGFDEFDPTPLKSLGYKKHPNVLTSIEFERVLSASGPNSGLILRPADGMIPRKIAFIQCIGSRDKKIGKEYCSSVCCMYTAKEAVIAKEHMDIIEPTIFTMDVRAYGKDFDKYIERAKKEYGIRYVRSRVSLISQIPETRDLLIQYETEGGDVIEETFNLVVLAVGAEPNHSAKEISEVFGIELNEYGFCKTNSFAPVKTSKPGIYVCGMFAGPKDIPETVIEASAASGEVNALLSEARGTLISKKELPKEIDVSDQEPRIGIFVCHCGINIGGVVDVPKVVEYAKTLPYVAYAEHNLYTCSADTQTRIKDMIRQYDINRVIVASCTPRTHEPLFQSTIREAGLNKFLFEMANIRDQCSWVHMHEHEKATEKAKDLVRLAATKAKNLKALKAYSVSVIQKALVIGGGIGGMTAALNLADQGYDVYLVEKTEQLGGFANLIYQTLENDDVPKFISELANKVNNHELITIFLNTTIDSISGNVCDFNTKISYEGSTREVKHGVIIVATGAKEYEPNEFLYGQDERIITQSTFEKLLYTSKKVKDLKSIVMVQCIGSRNEEHQYCSRICCAEAIKNALKAHELNPELNVVILYRDIRTYGFKEKYYNLAREKGILFIRFDENKPPDVKKEGKNLNVVVEKPDLGEIIINTDLVVLSAGIEALEENEVLAPMLKVPINEDNFFLEAHVKLRPSEFATEGIFLCGTARGAANISETVSQASSAASRAVTILSKKYLISEGPISHINADVCIGCGRCADVCAFNAIELITYEKSAGLFNITSQKANINETLCKGCGTCVPECPVDAIDQIHFTTFQIKNMIDVFNEEEFPQVEKEMESKT